MKNDRKNKNTTVRITRPVVCVRLLKILDFEPAVQFCSIRIIIHMIDDLEVVLPVEGSDTVFKLTLFAIKLDSWSQVLLKLNHKVSLFGFLKTNGKLKNDCTLILFWKK